MQKIFMMSGLIALMSLGPATLAQSKPLEQSSNVDLPASSYLIASPFQTNISPAHQRRHRLMQMLVLQMEMNELAEESMSSEDPEVKALATELMDSGGKMTDRLLQLIQSSPRTGQFSR